MSESRGQRAMTGAQGHGIIFMQVSFVWIRSKTETASGNTPGSSVSISRTWFLAVWLKQPQPRGDEAESQGAPASASGLLERTTHHKRPLFFCSDREMSHSAQFWLQAVNFRQILFQRFTFLRLFLTLSTTSVIFLIKEDFTFSRN